MSLAAIAPIVIFGGCNLLRKPDMTQPAGIADLRRPGQPLILIHGFLGSRLRDAESHRIAWGTMLSIMRGAGRGDLALPLAGGSGVRTGGDRLEAYEIYDGLWGVEFYSKILDSLEEAGGYQFGDIRNPAPGDNAFIYVYDWRRDIAESAAGLARAIEGLKEKLGRPDLRFDLMGHSLGGLIARYYVAFGEADVLGEAASVSAAIPGAPNVNKVIMLGTPNRGCLESLRILHVGVKKVFRPMRPEVVFTMPSVFEMLPPPGTLNFADAAGNPVPLDLYDPATWEREEWSAFSRDAQERLREEHGAEGLARRNAEMRRHLAWALARGARLHRVLDDAPPAEGVAYHAFGSDCVSTLKTAILLPRRGGPEGSREIVFDEEGLRDKGLSPRVAELLYGPGDGTVLMQSLLALPEEPGSVDFESAFFVCERHGYLPTNPIFQNNLLYLLLRDGGVSAPEPGAANPSLARSRR